MDSEKRENLIKKLQNAVEDLIKERPSAYERCVDITEKLFYKHDKVILEMNYSDFMELNSIWHQHYDIQFPLMIVGDFQTPHGVPVYTIVSDSIKGMNGYILKEGSDVHKI